jgi:hypothetical protein
MTKTSARKDEALGPLPPAAFKDGRINRAQIEAGMERLAYCGKDVTRIVVTHHTPPILCPGPKSRIAGVGETTKPYRLPGRAVLLIRAGTATSTRQAWRGECLQCHTDRSARCGNRLHGLAAWGGTVRIREHGAVQADRGRMVASGACTGIVNSQAVAEAASETIARSNERSND